MHAVMDGIRTTQPHPDAIASPSNPRDIPLGLRLDPVSRTQERQQSSEAVETIAGESVGTEAIKDRRNPKHSSRGFPWCDEDCTACRV
jgi:hypothetical protein